MTSYTVDIRQRYRRAATVATDPSETVYRRSVSFLYVCMVVRYFPDAGRDRRGNVGVSATAPTRLAAPGVSMRVRDIMTTKVFTIRPDKHLRAVEEIMKWAHIRHVPVIDDHGRLVGIVSHRDLMGAAISSLQVRISDVERVQHLSAIEVRQLMHHPTATIAPDERVQRAAHLMRSLKVGCLPVLEDQHLVGIVTEADLLHIVEELPDAALARPVSPLREPVRTA